MTTYLAHARRRPELFVVAGAAAAAIAIGAHHTTTAADTTDRQPVVQTPAAQMVLPGQQQPVQLPPGIRPGVTYLPHAGTLDPFDALGAPPPAPAAARQVLLPLPPLQPAALEPVDLAGLLGVSPG
jgi:hypothetical protein